MNNLKVKLTLSNYFNMSDKFNKLSKELLERQKIIDEIKEYMAREEFQKNTEMDLANNIKLIEREVNGECYLESLKKCGEREILNFLKNIG